MKVKRFNTDRKTCNYKHKDSALRIQKKASKTLAGN